MSALVDAARAYLGVPFRHQGRNRLGLDCGGLLVLALRDIGKVATDITGYSRNPHNGRLESVITANAFFLEVPVEKTKEGDVLLIAYKQEPHHIAIKTDIGIIHATSVIGKVAEHRLTPDFGHVVKAYRIL